MVKIIDTDEFHLCPCGIVDVLVLRWESATIYHEQPICRGCLKELGSGQYISNI